MRARCRPLALELRPRASTRRRFTGLASPPAPLGFGTSAERTHLSLAGLSHAFTELIRGAAEGVRSEEIAFADAAESVYARLADDLDRHLLDPELVAAAPLSFLSVYGRRDGRPARATTWFPQALCTERNFIELTAANTAVTTARLLRGELSVRGGYTLSEHEVLDADYAAEVVSRLPDRPEGATLMGQRLEFLDGEGGD